MHGIIASSLDAGCRLHGPTKPMTYWHPPVAGPWYIAWSFFASVVGAWCISAPGYFAVNTGILGLASYAVSSGLPILVLAFCGAHILRRHPNVVSVSDFASRRFGPTMKLITSLICLFNMVSQAWSSLHTGSLQSCMAHQPHGHRTPYVTCGMCNT